MKDSILYEAIQKFEALYNFTVQGIETHLTFDEIDTERITDALTMLGDNLFRIIEEAKERYSDGSEQESI